MTLLGIPGDNTYSNYQEATRTFWRATVLPLVNRTAKSLSAWLSPAYGTALELKPDIDAIEALSTEREALWTRIDKSTFLTPNEKRSAVGYGPVAGGDEIKADVAGWRPTQRAPAGFPSPLRGGVRGGGNPHGSADDDTPPDETDNDLSYKYPGQPRDALGQFDFGKDPNRPQPASRGRRPPSPPPPPRRQPPPPGIGHNRPPRDPPPPEAIQRAISDHRFIHDLGGDDVVAYAPGLPEGSRFGVNSGANTYTSTDRAAANDMRSRLIARFPDVMQTENIGLMPNIALYHAETTLLLRAARAKGGSLAGMEFEVHVDGQSVCNNCQRVLPYVGLELGNPTVTFVNPSGVRRTMRDGGWVRRGE